MEENKPSLWFVMNEEAGDLYVNFDPDGHAPPNNVIFKQALEDSGYAQVQLVEGQTNAFLAACRSSKEVLTWLIGKRQDAEISLVVDEDWMAAYLTLVPARGGKPATKAIILDLLKKYQISHGILHAEIDAIMANGGCEKRLVARGDPISEGNATRFESLLEQKQHELSHIDESAVVKFRDLSHLLLVEPGDHLMRRYPAIQGKNGINIKGDVAFAPALPEQPFATEYPGAAPDPNDMNLLVATSAGQPTLVGHGVRVNPVIDVDNVDLSVGNIEFDGTVQVKGDVIAGMRIKVSGDVIIRGTLEAAEIVAGGCVSVDGGIVGHADPRPGAQRLPKDTARIKCKGSVQAMFIENAHVEAGDSIFVERSVRQCELIALNDIIVGKEGNKLSSIVGGISHAKHLIKVLTLGSSAGIKTLIQLGHDPYADDDIATKEQILKSKHQELEQVQKLLAFFKVNPKKGEGGLAQKVDATRAQLISDIGRGMLELEALKEKLALDEDARVEVGKMAYYGTEVRMGNHVLQIKDDMPATIIGWKDGNVVSGLDPVKPKKEDEPETPPSPGLSTMNRFG
ncbi:MAG: hypothetical protein RL748_3009 [Pseudomonadota bacterium]|jgi:uncharacterized protein (DUF342 family)